MNKAKTKPNKTKRDKTSVSNIFQIVEHRNLGSNQANRQVVCLLHE